MVSEEHKTMKTQFFRIGSAFREEELETAAELIRQGGLVAFPTETVYGLGADAENAHAARKIYAAKGRPSDNPLIVHICDVSQVFEIADNVPEDAERLWTAFWPGPLTIVLKKNGRIPIETTGGLDTVAIRLPENPVAKALIRRSGKMIAAPSANLSGKPSPTSAAHVIEDMDGRVDGIIISEDCRVGLESTIVDLSEERPIVLRPGDIGMSALRRVLPDAVLDTQLKGGHPKAPGMKYRHYAPRAELYVTVGERAVQQEKVFDAMHRLLEAGKKGAILCVNESVSIYRRKRKDLLVLGLGDKGDSREIARNLFGALRRLDEEGIDLCVSESFSEGESGDAVMNRLLKAAGGKTI